METFDLGNFELSTGFTLANAKLAYKTLGTLSERKDNAILFPHFLGGSPEALGMWIGDGRALDPGGYFIICPGQLGDGVSSSPSNTAPPFDRGAFPAARFADDVIAQHRLVTEKFGITELQLVLGWSTGALQTYEWAVRFSSMVKRIASIAGAPRPSPWTKLWLQTVLEDSLTSVMATYRVWLFGQAKQSEGVDDQGQPVRRGIEPERVKEVIASNGRLPIHEYARCRARYFVDGAVFGTREFVENIFQTYRERFGSNRENGARAVRGLDGPPLFVLRNLRKSAFG